MKLISLRNNSLHPFGSQIYQSKSREHLLPFFIGCVEITFLSSPQENHSRLLDEIATTPVSTELPSITLFRVMVLGIVFQQVE